MTRPASPRVRAGAVVLVVAGAFAEVHGGNDVILLAVLDWLVGAAFAAAAVWTGADRWVALLAAGTWYLGTVAGTAGWLGTIGTAAVLRIALRCCTCCCAPGADRCSRSRPIPRCC